jgi:lipoprotein-anchoring transpeptidase ErfK/SrfK
MSRIEISVGRQQLMIRGPGGTRRFPAGVGGDGTPTPTGVTGYLQARYLDPRQGQSVFRIQLTSLHAVAADEPYGGSDGGLIGLHLGSGSSHGCIRLGPDAIAAVDALPLGTPIVLVR